MTVVIVRDDLLERVPKDLPPMLDYQLQADNDSLYNTPPVFAIYVLMLVGRWLKNEVGGLAKMAELNREKAKLLYDVLDEHPGFLSRPCPGRQPLDDERHLAAAERRVGSRRSSKKPRREAWSISRAIARWAESGPRSTTPCRARACAALRDFMLDFHKQHAQRESLTA